MPFREYSIVILHPKGQEYRRGSVVAIDSAVPRREVAPPPPFSPYGGSPPPEVPTAFLMPLHGIACSEKDRAGKKENPKHPRLHSIMMSSLSQAHLAEVHRNAPVCLSSPQAVVSMIITLTTVTYGTALLHSVPETSFYLGCRGPRPSTLAGRWATPCPISVAVSMAPLCPALVCFCPVPP